MGGFCALFSQKVGNVMTSKLNCDSSVTFIVVKLFISL
jgi:hypothetical protein